MPTRVIILATPKENSTEGLTEYSDGVQPLMKSAGASLVFRGPVVACHAGDEPPASITVLEFSDVDAASEFFEQEAYQELIPLRNECFSRMEIYTVE
ncbi:DUF1330 domain-containing protein [uncultured Litoreibacter sp.]|uniref:DUF1330 domain-containing protein n=1 Tax=uncultured Litoreibacter sp. TaxID=1392394 RepID=UPI00262774AB|nr:DUF1330 domain-containing protein [uncultured Litoreibacter sp.]